MSNPARKFVSDMYNSVTWRQKVTNMSNRQVFAIYCKEKAKPKTITPTQDPEFHQFKFDNLGNII